MSGILVVPDLFDVTTAPREALVSLHAGELALLACLDDDELDSIGLSVDAILQSVRLSETFTDDERERLLQLWEQVRASSVDWVRTLVGFVHPDEGWRDFVSLHWCLRNPYFDETFLASGPLGTFTNAMLEFADLRATVLDVHSAYASLASQIADGKLSGTEGGLVFAGTMLASFGAGWFTAGTGVPAIVKASGWIDERLKSVDGWVLELAFEFIAADTAEDTCPQIHQAIARKIFDEARGIARRSSGSDSDRQQRMLLNAYRGLTADTPLEEHRGGVPLPDFSDQTVKQVRRFLEGTGMNPPYTIDAAQLDNPRDIWNDSAWVVRAQKPEPGAIVDSTDLVVIAYSRPGEHVRMPQVNKAMDGG